MMPRQPTTVDPQQCSQGLICEFVFRYFEAFENEILFGASKLFRETFLYQRAKVYAFWNPPGGREGPLR